MVRIYLEKAIVLNLEKAVVQFKK